MHLSNYEGKKFFFLPVKMKHLALIDAIWLVVMFIADSWEGVLLLFQNGMLKAVQNAGATIVVIAMSGIEKIYRNVFRRKTEFDLS